MNSFKILAFFLVTAFPAVCLAGPDLVLTGWHDFQAGYGLYQNAGSAKASVGAVAGVTGNLYGGSGSRNTWGSTDATYGPAEPVGTSAVNGSMSIKVNNPNLYFTVTNGTAGNLLLSRIDFDFASVAGSSPQNMQIYYGSGDLAVPNGTLVLSMTSIHNGLGNVSNYEDVSAPLDVLADQALAPGESAVFRFKVDTSTNNTQALGLDNIAIMGQVTAPDFRILTYNIHGGEGPSGTPGNITDNLEAFRDNVLQGEEVLCLQEVGKGSSIEDEWAVVTSVFADYPYRFRTINETTKFFNFNKTACAVLSKRPFTSTHEKLIQIDPQGDLWERHAQHVQILLGADLVHIFNFHNTYNFGDNDFESEKEGLQKFKEYVLERLAITDVTEGGNLLMMGDFNVFQNGSQDDVNEILPTPARAKNGRDHLCTVPLFSDSGFYTTVAQNLSDHNAVWASLDLQAPSPDASQWAAVPEEAGTSAITMTAATATDPNAVEYYFTNSTVADGSHDSGWQENPVYTDAGLDAATTYAYTVVARDKSVNQNETGLSAMLTATTDDGDGLPNDWEWFYFSSLDASSGGPLEDWDKDGLIDFHEWIAGTDPTDPLSHFSARLVMEDEETLTIHWSSVAGKTYRVTVSPTLKGVWTPIATGLLADGPESSHDVTITDPLRMFYRVEVAL